MHQGEIAGFMKALAPVIGEFVVRAMEPLKAECKRLADELAGVKADAPSVDEATVARLVGEAVAKLPPAEAGKDADPALVAELVDKAVAALPPAQPGEPGKSVTVEDLAPLVAAEVEKAVAAIERPNVPDAAMIALMIGEKVEAVVGELPPAQRGEPGKSVTVEDLAPLVVAEVEKAVANMPVNDAVGLAGALIDREGHLVLTLSDGATKTLGRVVGTDGADVDMDVVRSTIKAEVEALPKPRDGTDGFGFDDMDLVEEDGDLFLRFTRGERVKDFLLPVPTDRGVWVEREFSKGAGVTWGGSFWIAQRATSAKPDTRDSGWRLAVKRGRDGASAYDVARRAGFRGGEREWLDSLRPGPAKPVKVD